MKRIFLTFLIPLFMIYGCASLDPQEEKPAHELASDGMEEFKKKNYRKAIDSFEKLRDWYPFSKFAILAELKIADSHYYLKEYEEAVFAYEEFEGLHPGNEVVPYVIYQIGLCYFEQIDTIDRDQTSSSKALDIFKRLKQQFPENEYALKADEHINICLKNLAEHEYYVGLFYYKSKHYKAALHRFRKVVKNYPDIGIHQKALKHIALCEALLQKAQKKVLSD